MVVPSLPNLLVGNNEAAILVRYGILLILGGMATKPSSIYQFMGKYLP